jgi:hypothetical protein
MHSSCCFRSTRISTSKQEAQHKQQLQDLMQIVLHGQAMQAKG